MEDDIVKRLLKVAAVSEIIKDNPKIYYDAAHEIARLCERLAEADEANRRVSDENEKLREALAAERERCARVAEQARDDTCDGPVAWSMADSIAAAIRESGNE